MQVASSSGTANQTVIPNIQINAAGLKEALRVGLTNSVTLLNQQDAFYAN